MLELVVLSEVPIVAAGLKQVLAEQPDFNVIHSCSSRPDAVQSSERLRPSVVLCNLAPNADLRVIYEIRSVVPESPIVLFVREIPSGLAHQALDMGVRGILPTTAQPETLCACLRSVAAGQTWIEGSLAAEMLNAHRVSLSPRQLDLMQLLVRGLSNKEIAWQLGLTVGTVKAYLTTLFEKVGAKDRFELALFGLKYLKHVNPSLVETDRLALSRPAA